VDTPHVDTFRLCAMEGPAKLNPLTLVSPKRTPCSTKEMKEDKEPIFTLWDSAWLLERNDPKVISVLSSQIKTLTQPPPSLPMVSNVKGTVHLKH